MKFSQLILFACISVCLSFVACKDNPEESKTATPESVSPNANPTTNTGVMDPTTASPTPSTPQTPTATATPSSSGSVQHYECQTAGCTGGSASKGACSICGAELVHNQAYHTQNQSGQQANPTVNQTQPVMIDPATGKPATPEQLSPPSAQNSAGEYHYACPAGHPGSGSAGNCSTCGAELAHNSAYHNK